MTAVPHRSLPLLMMTAMLALLSTLGREARASEPLVADLSEHLVAITTDFTGAELLLFGAVDGPGDIVVIVRGPREDVVVRRKERTVGIWVNRSAVTFQSVPSFFWLSASAPIALEVPLRVRQRHQMGPEYLRLQTEPVEDGINVWDFREALIRNMRRQGLFGVRDNAVQRIGNRLFRTTVAFPANVPTGTYTIETLLIREGEVASAQTTPLFVSKVGFGAQLFRWAYRFPALYGVAAILIACFAGLFANWIFRKS